MPKKKMNHAQAQLHLQLYDLRREAKIRQAREWFARNFHVDSMDDVNRLAPPNSQENAYMRMLVGYWEQACLLLNQGLLDDEFFFRTNGEFFMVWERIKAITPELRKTYRNPLFFEAMEKAALRYEKWCERRAPGSLKMLRQMMQQMRAAQSQN